MKRSTGNAVLRWLVIGLVLLPAMTLRAQTAGFSCPDPDATLLWRVAGIDHEVYLFGTLHLGKAGFYPLPPRVEQAFRNADYMVFEADIEAAASFETLMSIQQRGRLPAGETLDQHLSDDTMTRLEEALGGFGVPVAMAMNLQPWFLNVMLTALQMTEYGFMPQFGAESYLLAERSADAELRELESIEAQLGFLESLNSESYLRYTLASIGPDVEQEIDEMARAWRCADKAALAEMIFSDLEEAPLSSGEVEMLQETLYFSRNRDMAGKISEYIQAQDGDYFIAVGAAHLIGELSIIDHLRQRGHELEVVPGR